ncbi:pantetheine-phosphate adenylyltransferase [Acidimicrobiaceae bacterium]|jgi:pantetheine-phosphate adenylyltransferase|nr:pantetheine-phosphate adenylyltransferase [Candidatus Actinomarina sp.]MDC0076947.1 pantetheine-phosphate adenylyltransferase [Acidimicrobiaceae bacterium]|tara:strand:- start:1008 stop:1472 length:465 start_codon:yes stop_codon:yes gene_type:complete
MKILIPGSFDPPTNGHIDVINRCSKIFSEIIVGVVVNPSKDSLFTRNERSEMLENIFQEKENIKVESFEGLLVDFASKNSVDAIVKGLRAMTDFDYEFQMAQANSTLAGYETIFIPSSPEYGYLSSSMVKEIHSYGGDVSSLVPSEVLKSLKNE